MMQGDKLVLRQPMLRDRLLKIQFRLVVVLEPKGKSAPVHPDRLLASDLLVDYYSLLGVYVREG
jgi:hypothetical protein